MPWRFRSRQRFNAASARRTLAELSDFVRPLSGMMPYAYNRPEAAIQPTICSALPAD
jgi:hypothetical protein